MKSIAFFDTEIDPTNHKILDIGCIRNDGNTFHSSSIPDFIQFLSETHFICGHNILQHDLKYISGAIAQAGISSKQIIDTLYVSPLLFPLRPYHALLKDDKLQTEDLNNPLNDSIKAKDLFFDETSAFSQAKDNFKRILYLLLNNHKGFQAFFSYLSYACEDMNVEELIRETFQGEICLHSNLSRIISDSPIELAYCLSLINCRDRYSITPAWVLINFPKVESLMLLLRNTPCLTGCKYCDQALDVKRALKKYFGYDSYRLYGGDPLQEKAVKAAVDNKSLLAIFPTGGGKSITFQVPALMSGENVKGLTVVISPLQSLMKDQVDNLEKAGITDAVTINGLLSPIERRKSIERVIDGSAALLYISPESLRSKTIERILLGRKIVRFVIDEAHCFSAWGQDFRVDYLYIADFIKLLRSSKNLDEPIPVSCFSATAKQQVIEDICVYFKGKLDINLEVFASKVSRNNLQYKVFGKREDDEKYNKTRDLIEYRNCPTIIYVSRTRKANKLAERLQDDGFNARPYHGKMNAQEKTDNQTAFIDGKVQIMVATSAFGMGVDKKDVGMVIHYEISDSIENYIQEAGRAGRDQDITADCFVLFDEEDLSKHFILLNQTKINIQEIKQIWNAIKLITKFRLTAQYSPLEIARKAGWDDNVKEIETRVIAAIAALEDAGYLKRGQNMPQVYANSILSKTAQEAIDKISRSTKFINEDQRTNAIRIVRKLFSSKSRKHTGDEEGESRIDYISDHLGIVKEEVISVINVLREEKILADAQDLTAFIKRGEHLHNSLGIVETFGLIENFLSNAFEEEEQLFHIKELNGRAEKQGCTNVSPQKIKTILNFWAIKKWIRRKNTDNSKNHIVVFSCQSKEVLQDKLVKRHSLALFIVKYLFGKGDSIAEKSADSKDMVLVEFSVLELKEVYERNNELFKVNPSVEDIEDALFYLSRIDAITIEGGFLVVYNKLTIERVEQNSKVQYKERDYQKLNHFYENKVQQIHIVGEYAKKMIEDYESALRYVDDYFQLNYFSFLNKYFPGTRQLEIRRNITPAKYRQLFDSLSNGQRKIIDDKESRYIVVAAGPGSGKTKVLVHKLASLLLMEDVKHEQLLMVTFSRAAATEFKRRLIALIGNAANYIEIKTFHSYCFDLLGKVGSVESSNLVIKNAIDKIKKGDIEVNRITKAVLVIDEAQDMDADEFELIKALMDRNEAMRVIAVGDDDQNIYGWRGANSRYLQSFIYDYSAAKYELIVNYRSKNNIVAFSVGFARGIRNRMKVAPIIADQQEDGEIRIIKYQSKSLIVPLVDGLIKTELTGTTCVLTFSNDEAFQVAGLLIKNNIHARLIQANDNFKILNLMEIRSFLDELRLEEGVFTISDELWESAKRKFITAFADSSKLEVCLNLIKDFESTNPAKKYKSDLEIFILESKLEDFYKETGDVIFVSTIHKAKGKEFDNIILLLEDFNPVDDDSKRLLYVAMTRAKRNLTIHLNGDYLDFIEAEHLERIQNNAYFLPPQDITVYLTHEDIYLGYFKGVQQQIDNLKSGCLLVVAEEGCKNENGVLVLKFSNKFSERLANMKKDGFKLNGAIVNYIVFWTSKDDNIEMKIILPELHLRKMI